MCACQKEVAQLCHGRARAGRSVTREAKVLARSGTHRVVERECDS